MARVLITGAASGIGQATAWRLAASGAGVACLDVDREGLVATMARLDGGVAVTANITDPAAVEHAVAHAAAGLGGLDAVANVAGIGDFSGDVTQTLPDEWQRVIEVNLTGMYHVSRAAIPHIRAAGGGAIVNVSSQYGLVGCLASPAYCASKAGVVGLTKAMALDHAGEGIRVNCVCPGPVDTPMLQRTAATPEAAERERVRTEHRNLVGRPAQAEEIAATIAFILSVESGSMTGSVLTVDGGWTAG